MNPLVFLHGWGQSSQIWYQQRPSFADAHYLNLPGHGGCEDSTSWIESLAKQLPETPCHLIGWSLGGMLAMRLSMLYPERIQSLILINSTPCFCQASDWVYGCDDLTFKDFEKGAQHQAGKTMSRFFALMFHGENMARNDYNAMARHAINRQHPPCQHGLQYGLQLLSEMDLRNDIANITQPTLILYGDCDAIIQPESSHFLAQHIPHATLHRFKGAGHAPFLSQSQQFNSILEQWCQTN